jgi:hypothetical protein
VHLVRGGDRTIRFRFYVPKSLRPGHRVLRFRGTDPDGASDPFDTITIDLTGGGGSAPDTEGPRTVGQLAAEIDGLRRYDGVRLRGPGTHVYRDAQLRIGGRADVRVVVAR